MGFQYTKDMETGVSFRKSVLIRINLLMLSVIRQLGKLCRFSEKFICQIRLNLSTCTVKHVLSGHSKIDKTKILMTNGSLLQV